MNSRPNLSSLSSQDKITPADEKFATKSVPVADYIKMAKRWWRK